MVVVAQLLSGVWLFASPFTAARQASLSFTIFQSLLKLMSIESMMQSNHLVLVSSCLQSFLASGSFLMSQLFSSGSQSIGALASASVLSMNIQDWFPLQLTGLISLQSKGLTRIFSSTSLKTTVFQHSALFMVQLSRSYMATGKAIALTIWQSNVSAF